MVLNYNIVKTQLLTSRRDTEADSSARHRTGTRMTAALRQTS